MKPLSAQIRPRTAGARPGRGGLRVRPLVLAALAGFALLGTIRPVSAADDAATNLVATVPAVRPSAMAPGPAFTNHVNVLDDQYRLAMGDQLSFRIVEDEEAPKIIVVTDSGDLEVPYIGRYPALGKTCKQLAQELKQELEKEYYWQATVIIAVDSKPKSRGKIYLVGAISAPGPQDIAGDEALTVSKAILRAGGLTGFADGKAVRVTRSTGPNPGNEKTFTVNVSRVFEKGKTEDDLALQPGDLIYVPERLIRF
jgi:polysaccharide export outer membrane protein